MDPKAARTVALTVPPEQVPEDKRIDPKRAAVAQTIAAFIDDITREKPWAVYDPDLKRTRPARPGDIAILVRKMTPDFVAPLKTVSERARSAIASSAARSTSRETKCRRSPRSCGPSTIQPTGYRSCRRCGRPCAVSDADLLHFVSTKGILNINAPQGTMSRSARCSTRSSRCSPGYTGCAASSRRRSSSRSCSRGVADRILMKPSGAQMVANLWKVLETARAYEAAAPATLRAFVRFLQDEEGSSRAEGDSPVGEPIGASVEIVTVHKAKGLEYPIVIVADLFTSKLPASDCIIDHAAARRLKIGPFRPDGWEEQSDGGATAGGGGAAVALCRHDASARSPRHSVSPGRAGRELAWLGRGYMLVRPIDHIPFSKRESNVTWFDSRHLDFGVQGAGLCGSPRQSMARKQMPRMRSLRRKPGCRLAARFGSRRVRRPNRPRRCLK